MSFNVGVVLSEALLSVTSLYCERDERVLFQDLSFALRAGQVIQVAGQNGSGKSTLLRILCGLHQGYEGDVAYRGEEIAQVRDLFCASLLYFGHQAGIKAGLTVRENLEWYCKIHPRLEQFNIDEALIAVGLDDYDDVLCQQLSAGQKRRVSLARLYLQPLSNVKDALWVLDEPYTAIDVQGVAKLEKHLDNFVAAGGALLITTHQDIHLQAPVLTLNLDVGELNA